MLPLHCCSKFSIRLIMIIMEIGFINQIPANQESYVQNGLPPGPYCTNLVSDDFIPLVSPASQCNNWSEIFVSPDEKISYCRVCMPENGYRKKMYKIIPPEMEEYYDIHKIAYEKIPPHNPLCEKVFREGAPAIVSPKMGMNI